MNLNINGHHLEVTPAIRNYVIEKLDRVKRHFDHVIDASVTISVVKLVQGQMSHCTFAAKTFTLKQVMKTSTQPLMRWPTNWIARYCVTKTN